MAKIRVVAAVIDIKQLTLYKEDGSTLRIPQGDPRIQPILDEVTPIVSQGKVATIDVTPNNAFSDFEKQSNGFVRFFRTTKRKFASFFGGDHTTDIETIQTEYQTAIADIMQNAQPVSDMTYVQGETTIDETIVAVVHSDNGPKAIPGMENLKEQFAYASRLGSTEGVKNFLKRLSAVIEKRQHSIHDLLRFMERGDLPIADDGSIIIYKVLRSSGDKNELFVDCHTGNVPQRVGSFVCMDEALVDPNRRNECSNGLHVARRGYIKGFSGDVCVLAKLAPEDVIAVPSYDADKMRVCGYHIIFKLTKEHHELLKNNKPMTEDPKAQAILARAIKGDHIGKIEEVRITSHFGGGVVITKLDNEGNPAPKPKVQPGEKAHAIDPVKGHSAPVVDPKTVAKTVSNIKKSGSTRSAEAHRMLATVIDGKSSNVARRKAAQNLIAFKKKAKVGWDRLNIIPSQVEFIMEVSKLPDDPKPVKAKKPVKKPAPKLAGTKATMVIVDDVPPVTPRNVSNQEHARALFNQGHWASLAAFKRAKKKSWEVLGFTSAEIDKIKTRIIGKG